MTSMLLIGMYLHSTECNTYPEIGDAYLMCALYLQTEISLNPFNTMGVGPTPQSDFNPSILWKLITQYLKGLEH